MTQEQQRQESENQDNWSRKLKAAEDRALAYEAIRWVESRDQKSLVKDPN
jgi:hypothetical protein